MTCDIRRWRLARGRLARGRGLFTELLGILESIDRNDFVAQLYDVRAPLQSISGWAPF